MGALSELSLPPGFRFHPTDEELMVEYLCRKIDGQDFSLRIIGDVDLYKHNPWDLPDKALFGEKEWYFFSPRDRKYPNGSRPNRVAGSGYWKATGTDKAIAAEGRKVGIKKALVFYVGRAPKGSKTNWIMHEYRLFDPPQKNGGSRLDDWVLCRIYKKTSGAERAAAAAATAISGVNGKEYGIGSPSSTSSLHDNVSEIEHQFSASSSITNFQQEDQKLGSSLPEWADFGLFSDLGPSSHSMAEAHLLTSNNMLHCSANEPQGWPKAEPVIRPGFFQENAGMFESDPALSGSGYPYGFGYRHDPGALGYMP